MKEKIDGCTVCRDDPNVGCDACGGGNPHPWEQKKSDEKNTYCSSHECENVCSTTCLGCVNDSQNACSSCCSCGDKRKSYGIAFESAWSILKNEDPEWDEEGQNEAARRMAGPHPFSGNMSDVYHDLIGQAAMTLEGGMGIGDYIQSQHQGLSMDQINEAQEHVRQTLLRLILSNEGVPELGHDLVNFDVDQDTCSGCGGQKTPDHPHYGPDGPENGNCDGELPECDIHQGDGELGKVVSEIKERTGDV